MTQSITGPVAQAVAVLAVTVFGLSLAFAEGWEAPVAGALTQPVPIGGLPRDYAILNGTLALVLGLALKL